MTISVTTSAKRIGKVIPSTLVGAVLGSAAAYAADIDTIATGLHNPRGLTFDAGGNLFVGEAGLGAGDGHGGVGAGIGLTGSVTEIRRPSGRQPHFGRVVRGLASNFTPGEGVTGPDGVASRDDKLYVVESLSTPAVLKGLLKDASSLMDAQLDTAEQFGKLLSVSPEEDKVETIAAVGDFDYAWTDVNRDAPFAPKGQFPDANPYAVLALQGRQFVADAASNTIDEVLGDGSVRIVVYVPNPSVSDAVPTCVALGADHKLYVGTLAFGPNLAFKSPQSKVYRFDPDASAAVQFLTESDVWASGFFPITGCGFGADGFYVTEFWTSLTPPGGGDVVRVAVNADGTAGARTYFGAGVLKLPNGFAAGPDGAVYVSNESTSPQGSVVRIRP